MIAKAFFMNVRENNKTFCQIFRVLKDAIFGIFEHPKTFFWQNVFLFFCPIHPKYFSNHFLIFFKTKRTCFQQQFF